MTSEARTSPYVVLVIVLTATFMQLVDVSIVNTAIPAIQRHLHATYANIQLVLVFYLLAFACLLVVAARLGDIYGRKRLFMTGMTGFTLASAACGAAPNATFLVFARLAQGLMSGLMFPQVLAVVQVTFPPRERAKAFGIYGATIGIATILGPLLGGLLISWNLLGWSWRTIFYVNVPVGVAALVAAALKLHETRAPGAGRLDIPGAGLVAAALFLLVYPMTEGRELGWPWWLDLMMVASLPLFALFAGYERRRTRTHRSPLLLMSLFANRAFRVGLVLSIVFMAAIPAFFFTFAVYLQIGEGFTALGSGLTTFAFAVGSALASARSDLISARLGNRILLLGCAVLFVGLAAILLTVHAVGTHPHIYDFTVPFFVAGVGLGLFIAPVTQVILAGVTGAEAGSASGLLATGQQVGGAIGVAVIGVILFGLLGANAASAVHEVTPQLRAGLAAAGLPPSAQDEVLAGFGSCFEARAAQKDPTATPAVCRRSRPLPGLGHRLAGAGRTALGRDFSRSFQETLGYELLVVAVSLVLVTRLPTVRHDAAPVTTPAAA